METIDTNIPVPTKESKYAVLDKLAVGDSVLIAVPRSSSLSKTISNLQKKTGKRFQRQKVEGGVRVWRIEVSGETAGMAADQPADYEVEAAANVTG